MRVRITSLVVGTALVVTLIVVLIIGTFNLQVGDSLYEDQAYKQLLSIADSKADRVEDFLNNRKADAVFLAESEDVKNIFEEVLVSDVGLMTVKIKNIAEKTRDEIDNYIRAHPEMTVEDLQEDEQFQKIAVQRVGETGYTFVGDYENLFVRFHEIPEFVNFDFRNLEKSSPELWDIMKEISNKENVYGFAPLKLPSGVIKDKYHYATIINRRTADGSKLFVSATTYIDEYGGSIQLASDLDLEFKSFQENKGYLDLIFINLAGDVIWTAKQNNELGTNLITGVYNESLLANVFNKAKKDLGVGVSDSERHGPEEKLNIFITAPVMKINNFVGKEELRGILALQLDNEKISELIETDVGLGEVGEVYIINRDRSHITSLKFDGHTNVGSEIFDGEGDFEEHLEEVSSERIDACFEDYDNYYASLRGEETERVDRVGRYLDYAGDSNNVLGAHSYILESGWCVIAEMDEDYFLGIIPKTNKNMMINLLVDLTLLLIAGLILDNLFELKKRGRNK